MSAKLQLLIDYLSAIKWIANYFDNRLICWVIFKEKSKFSDSSFLNVNIKALHLFLTCSERADAGRWSVKNGLDILWATPTGSLRALSEFKEPLAVALRISWRCVKLYQNRGRASGFSSKRHTGRRLVQLYWETLNKIRCLLAASFALRPVGMRCAPRGTPMPGS